MPRSSSYLRATEQRFNRRISSIDIRGDTADTHRVGRLPRLSARSQRHQPACGTPFSAMTISSPDAARFTGPDKWVLASLSVTNGGIFRVLHQLDQ
ncbi:MAG TPA: hypothetical protein VL614_23665 [Acetobacteraceae bacterium]|jgi:hypothetical protein|nr:hypothetical protein [Acetobacteraceae bacterium]